MLFFLSVILNTVFILFTRVAILGVLNILLGVGLIKLQKKLGVLSLIIEIMEILAGLLLVFFLVEVGAAVIFLYNY